MINNTFSVHGSATLLVGATLVACLSGCVGDMPHRGAWGSAPKFVVAPAVAVSSDEYVYYPRYAIYFNRTRQQFVSVDAEGWISRSTPVGVAVEVLLDSPSVPMNFNDAPAAHHASVIRQYPRNWPAPGVAVMAGAKF